MSQASAEMSSDFGTVRRMTSRPDRHHHGAAHALDDAEQDEVGKALGEAASRRAEREDDNGGAEHGAGAEAVGHPAAQRDKDGKR